MCNLDALSLMHFTQAYSLKLGASMQSYNIQMVDITGKVVLNEVIVRY